jgi:hypothetical protein
MQRWLEFEMVRKCEANNPGRGFATVTGRPRTTQSTNASHWPTLS